MVDVTAIRAVRYARDTHGSTDLSGKLSPPYDVIDTALRAKLVAAHVNNVVHVDLPVGDDHRYDRAGTTYRAWIEEGVVVLDENPCITVVHQFFQGPDGVSHIRKGIIAGVALEPLDGGAILPHEYTLRGPKEDRLELFRACSATASQVFCVYDDPDLLLDDVFASLVSAPPQQVATTEDGVTQKIWWTDDLDIAAAVTQFFKGKTVLIADGHHRYETHLHYQNEQQRRHGQKEVPAGRVAMYLANIADPGTAVYPIHRLIRDLEGWSSETFYRNLSERFEITPCENTLESVKATLSRLGGVFGVMVPGREAYVLSTSPKTPLDQLSMAEPLRSFDVTVLHGLVLDGLLGIDAAKLASESHVDYVKAESDVMPKLASGRYQFACILPPPDPRRVAQVAAAGQRMPQKSTFFFPKIQSGVVFSPLS